MVILSKVREDKQEQNKKGERYTVAFHTLCCKYKERKEIKNWQRQREITEKNRENIKTIMTKWQTIVDIVKLEKYKIYIYISEIKTREAHGLVKIRHITYSLKTAETGT